MKSSRVLLILLAAACANEPERPVMPVDPETTARVYDATLAELKRIMTPAAGATPTIDWSERIHLNPLVLLPPSDSATPMMHDSTWMATLVPRGLVRGICGRPPARACPSTEPVAFTSLSPPWTQGGDTVYVQGGYAGEAPGEERYEGVFWIFTLAPDDSTGALKVVRKGLPNLVTFESE